MLHCRLLLPVLLLAILTFPVPTPLRSPEIPTEPEVQVNEPTDALDVRAQGVVTRTEEKVRLGAAFSGGQISRSEAETRFRELLLADPETLDRLKHIFPELTEEQIIAFNVNQHLSPVDGGASP